VNSTMCLFALEKRLAPNAGWEAQAQSVML
jgi:hypothetical protein